MPLGDPLRPLHRSVFSLHSARRYMLHLHNSLAGDWNTGRQSQLWAKAEQQEDSVRPLPQIYE